MLTDTLAPVVTEKGVATIVTADGMKTLCAGLTFRTIRVESYYMQGTVYGMFVNRPFVKKTGNNFRRIWLTDDALIGTVDGWLPVTEIFGLNGPKSDPRRLIKAYWLKCCICGKFYLPKRPIRTVCSPKCMFDAGKNYILGVEPLNALTVPNGMMEDWAEITTVKETELPGKIEAVRIVDLDGADGTYINGVLLSCKSLQERLKLKH